MLSPHVTEGHQIPLIHEVHADDQYLLNTVDGQWFEILHDFPWAGYRHHAAAYYEALYEFNIRENQSLGDEGECVSETKEQAQQRLLFDRATMQEVPTQILYEAHVVERNVCTVDPMELAPGVVPIRVAGRKPKYFFSLLKSFIGSTLMGFSAEPEQVYLLLKSNPSFARVCGFLPKEKAKPEAYDVRQVPALRKLEQFDQVMRQAGIWEQIKVSEVKMNFLSGVIKKENELVGDTTHYHAYSGFETVAWARKAIARFIRPVTRPQNTSPVKSKSWGLSRSSTTERWTPTFQHCVRKRATTSPVHVAVPG